MEVDGEISMTKVKAHLIDKREKAEAIGNLFDKFARLKSKEEILNFLAGLLSSSEVLMIARRIQIAEKILEEKTYEAICKELKVGSQNVSRIDNWLHSGDFKRDKWIQKIVKINERNKKKSFPRRNYDSLLDKYWFHRFWKDIFD